MPLLHLMLDGALAAAEMLALLAVPPAVAAPAAPAPTAVTAVTAEPATLHGPVLLHRLSTTVDIRLLGALADVRVAQHLRNDGARTIDLGARLPAVDEQVDALRVVRADGTVELLAAADCGEASPGGYARLAPDEAIADALQLPPGAEAVVEVIAAQPLQRRAGIYRVALPVAIEADAPRATLIDEDGGAYLVVVPHLRATAAAVTLRPTSGAARRIDVGPLDPRTAALIPLLGRIELDEVAEGAVEVELAGGGTTYWTTVVAERAEARAAVQARSAE
jgi:hypothetical protein